MNCSFQTGGCLKFSEVCDLVCQDSMPFWTVDAHFPVPMGHMKDGNERK